MPKLLQSPREGPSIPVLVIHRCPNPHQSYYLQNHSQGTGSTSPNRADESSLEVKVVLE